MITLNTKICLKNIDIFTLSEAGRVRSPVETEDYIHVKVYAATVSDQKLAFKETES